MSISTEPASNPHSPPAKGVSFTTLVLSLALAVCATVAVVLAVIHFRQTPTAGGASGGSTPGAAPADEPFVQKDTVSPQSKYTGVVYYPLPYGSPPNLKLSSPKRQYDIVKQDETGFTWIARPVLDDFKNIKDGEAMLGWAIDQLGANLKPNLVYDDFTWEAKGVRGTKETLAMKTFTQEGHFAVVAGKEGEVNFEIPFAIAPNVQFSGDNRKTVITECKPTGFRWKSGGTDTNAVYENGDVSWKAKGIRATELPKP
jgi:hypothetical protein